MDENSLSLHRKKILINIHKESEKDKESQNIITNNLEIKEKKPINEEILNNNNLKNDSKVDNFKARKSEIDSNDILIKTENPNVNNFDNLNREELFKVIQNLKEELIKQKIANFEMNEKLKKQKKETQNLVNILNKYEEKSYRNIFKSLKNSRSGSQVSQRTERTTRMQDSNIKNSFSIPKNEFEEQNILKLKNHYIMLKTAILKLFDNFNKMNAIKINISILNDQNIVDLLEESEIVIKKISNNPLNKKSSNNNIETNTSNQMISEKNTKNLKSEVNGSPSQNEIPLDKNKVHNGNNFSMTNELGSFADKKHTPPDFYIEVNNKNNNSNRYTELIPVYTEKKDVIDNETNIQKKIEPNLDKKSKSVPKINLSNPHSSSKELIYMRDQIKAKTKSKRIIYKENENSSGKELENYVENRDDSDIIKMKKHNETKSKKVQRDIADNDFDFPIDISLDKYEPIKINENSKNNYYINNKLDERGIIVQDPLIYIERESSNKILNKLGELKNNVDNHNYEVLRTQEQFNKI